MNGGHILATYLRRRYQIVGTPSDDDLAMICAGEGLEVDDKQAMPGRLMAFCVEGVAMIRAQANPAQRRWFVAHELAHHLLGHRNSIYLRRNDYALNQEQEQTAEMFAGTLFLGDRPAGQVDAEALATWANVPPEGVRDWLTLAQTPCQACPYAPGRPFAAGRDQAGRFVLAMPGWLWAALLLPLVAHGFNDILSLILRPLG